VRIVSLARLYTNVKIYFSTDSVTFVVERTTRTVLALLGALHARRSIGEKLEMAGFAPALQSGRRKLPQLG